MKREVVNPLTEGGSTALEIKNKSTLRSQCSNSVSERPADAKVAECTLDTMEAMQLEQKRDAIDALISEMKEALGITFIVISHDIVGTINVADHIAMLYGGNLVAFKPTEEFVRLDIPIVRQFLRRNLILPEGPDDVARLPGLE